MDRQEREAIRRAEGLALGEDTRELKEILGEDGVRVFERIEAALTEGNEHVKNAASVSAAILASHAKAWGEQEGRSAEEYLETVKVVARADDVTETDALHSLEQAKQAGLDPEQEVEVVDITESVPRKGANHRDIREYIRKLVEERPRVSTADNTAVFSILKKDIRHLTFSSRERMQFREHRARQGSIYAIESLLEKAVLVESEPNRKRDKKPNVRAYHRFYVPIRVKEKLYTVRLVAEEQEGVITLNPTDVNLYDIIIERSPRTAKGISPLRRPPRTSDTISIRDMLTGVKSMDGKSYFQRILAREQQGEGIVQGRTDFLASGARVVNLFAGADETTFLHEAAHILYDDLKQAAAHDALARRDLETVHAWAEWDEEQIETYRGAPWYAEFSRRDRAIRAAIAQGDKQREAALRAEWREERFARGFERYLAEGKAPTGALGRVFARCKRIFQNAYAAFRGSGGRASPAVEDVMARLVTPASARAREPKPIQSIEPHEQRRQPMNTREQLIEERDRLFSAVSTNKQRYRDFLGAMADHYKQPTDTQAALFLHAPPDGRAYATKSLWERMSAPVKAGAAGIDILTETGVDTVYEVRQTERAEDLSSLVWRYDPEKDEAAARGALLGADAPQGERMEDAVVRLCKAEAMRLGAANPQLVAAGAAYIALSRMGLDAEKKTALSILTAPFGNMDGRALIEGTMQAAAPVLDRVAAVVRRRTREERAAAPQAVEAQDAQAAEAQEARIAEEPPAPEAGPQEAAQEAKPEEVREEARNEAKAQEELQKLLVAWAANHYTGEDAQGIAADLMERIAPAIEGRTRRPSQGIERQEEDAYGNDERDVDGASGRGAAGVPDGSGIHAESEERDGISDVPAPAVRGADGRRPLGSPDELRGSGGSDRVHLGDGGDRGSAPSVGDGGDRAGAADGRPSGQGNAGEVVSGIGSEVGSGGTGEGTARTFGEASRGSDGIAEGGRPLGVHPEGLSPELPAGEVAGTHPDGRGVEPPEEDRGAVGGILPPDVPDARGAGDGPAEPALSGERIGAQDDPLGSDGGDHREPVAVTTEDAPRTDENPYASYSLAEIDWDADLSTTKGKRATFARNLAAIRVVKRLEESGRAPDEIETRLLKSYAGFGGLSETFDPRNTAWEKEYKALRTYLSNEEYISARASMLSAYYTPPELCKAIASGVQALGFDGGNVLEPSCGTGRFFDGIEGGVREKSRLVGIETDALSARIARAAHPDAEIYQQDMQASRFADGSFDLAIGNFPFGERPVIGDEKYEGQGILPHDYFFLKTLDQVRPGGLVCALTSAGTMDKGGARIREALSEKADLVLALRLPSSTFKGAGTSVTTDLLVFRKKDSSEKELALETIPAYAKDPAEWQGITSAGACGFPDQTINRYFAEHPECILGDVKERTAAHGRKELYVEGEAGAPLAVQIEAAFANLRAQGVYTPAETPLPPPVQKEIRANGKDMGYSIESGILVFTNESGETKEPAIPDEEKPRILSAVNLRDMGYAVLEAQTRGITDDDLRGMQKKLRDLYESHVDRFGRIGSDRKLDKFFQSDIGYPFVKGLEVWNTKRKEFERVADLFTERTMHGDRTPTHADSPQDALVLSIRERGAIDLSYMGALTNMEEADLIDALEYTHMYFDEQESRYVEESEFLSGNIYEKLEAQEKIIDEMTREEELMIASQFFPEEDLAWIRDENRIERPKEPDAIPEEGTPAYGRFRLERALYAYQQNQNSSNTQALRSALWHFGDFEISPDMRPLVAKSLAAEPSTSIYNRLPEWKMDAQLLTELLLRDKDFGTKIGHSSYAVRDSLAMQQLSIVVALYHERFLKNAVNPSDLDKWKERVRFQEVHDDLRSGKDLCKKLCFLREGMRQIDELCKASLDPETTTIRLFHEHSEKRMEIEAQLRARLAEREARLEERVPLPEGEEARRAAIRARRQRAEKNHAALLLAKPERIPFGDIDFGIGSTWIDKSHVEDFICEKLGIDKTYTPRGKRTPVPVLDIQYCPEASKWKLVKSGEYTRTEKEYPTAGMRVYATEHKSAVELLEACLNQTNVRVKGQEGRDATATAQAQMKQREIQKDFRAWILADEGRRQEIEDTYNRRFNNLRLRKYDGSHLVFPEMSNTVRLHPHQKDAIARHLYGGNTLFAHCVGAGKTYEMIASIMESKRLGMSHKAVMVVPKHLVGQTADAFRELYPRARVLAPSEKDLEGAAGRKRVAAQIATQSLDAAILSYSAFERLKLSPERERAFTAREIDRLEDRFEELVATYTGSEKKRPITIKAVTDKLDRLKKRLAVLEKKNQGKGDGTIPFDKLGVDKLVIDEAHYYKNLAIETRHSNVGGIGATDHSDKTWDLFVKSQYMNDLTGCRGLIFATGTPIANAMSELYTLQRYLTPQVLEDTGISHFDAWAANFAEISTAMELRPEGKGYREKERMRRFVNLPELMTQFRLFADVRTEDDIENRHVPKAVYEQSIAPASPYQKKMVQALYLRGEAIHNGNPGYVRKKDGTVTEDSMLLITREGRSLSLDPRILDPAAEDLPDSKVNRCVQNVLKEYEEHTQTKGTQIIFCDESTSTGTSRDGFNVYNDLRQKLIAGGIPKEEIAVVQEVRADDLEEKLFAPMREGKIRVLIGSTDKLGVGTNVQTHLCASHDLSVPWRPSDLKQREGRSIRPGNENETVKIYRYITEGTFDAYMWQTLENKQRMISQMMTGKCPVRTIEDMDEATLDFAAQKAAATDNPFIKEKMQLENELCMLRVARAGYETTMAELRAFVETDAPKQMKTLDARIANLMADKLAMEAGTKKNENGEEVFAIEINGKTYDDPKEAAKILHEKKKEGWREAGKVRGTYKGLKLRIHIDGNTMEPYLSLQGKVAHSVAFAQTGKEALTIRRMDSLLGELEKRIVKLKEEREPFARRIEDAKEKLKEPFKEAAREKEVEQRLIEINAAIVNDEQKGGNQAAREAPEASRKAREDAKHQDCQDYQEEAMAR